MKTYPVKQLVPLALIAAMMAGCASAPSRFYTLNSTAVASGAAAAHYGVAVGPVILPAVVDRPEFTVQAAPNRVEIEEFDRWAAPLNDNIARVVAGDLAVLLGTPQVAAAPMVNFDPAWRVTINIVRFESDRNKTTGEAAALVEAVWVVRGTAGGAARTGHTEAREPAPGGGFDALAAAHSRALAKVSGDIAAAIRAEAGPKP